MTEKMEKALNDQVKNEMYSAYLYLSMAMYFQSKNLSGLASWMQVQMQEEMFHAEKFRAYINDRGGKVILQALEQPPSDFGSPVNAFEETLKHEKFITSKINDLVKLSLDENDHATGAMLQWFVNEQVEEEATADEILQQLKLIGDNGYGIIMMDRELGQRVFTPPAAV